MTDYLSHATTATGVPITECEVCGQRHPVTRAHCSRCRSWSAFQRSGLCLICSEIVGVRTNACPSTLGVSTERPQPVSLHLTSRGLAATQPHLQEGGIVVDPTVPDPKRSRNLWRENGCTPACAETVPCPVCGNALPPCGRSVAPEVCLPDCCETHRYDLANTRHLWSADELDD